ncbi:glycosyltransferase family 2 protein [Methanobrevibacter sp.]|uniref:glycosyltransferase family 2 protein n=1 Tax=Methanobrevibacter sp. TaxID=66852 RepID=UPI0025E1BE79|nr:glycosyltransferase family 2 protein [Methanobrevibacter sp.]MBQ2961730.1 glycosyltransferase family 2 protein [Methanobrevibacter sp.]
MSEIRLSVIVPSYNSSNTIERLIHSLSNQIFKDFEIVFIDDNSTDNTADTIVKTLENSSIPYQLIVNETNRGPGYSRNRGLEKANGDHIVFIDSDDIVREDHLSTFYDNIKGHDSVFLKGLKVDDEGNLFDFKVDRFDPIIELSIRNDHVLKATDMINMEMLMEIPFSFVLLLYKKEIILKNNIRFNEEFNYGEDTEFAIRYLSNCDDVKFVNKYTYYYYQEEDSISRFSSLDRLESVQLFEGLYGYFNEFSHPVFADLSEKLIHSRIPKFILGNMNYFFYNDYDKDEIFKKMDELDLFNKLKEFKVYSKEDWKFKLKVVLFSLSPDVYYKLWKRFKNRI